MANPWRLETYTGPWSDKDPKWSENYKKQDPWNDVNDGRFFVDIDTYKANFLYFVI